MKPGPLLVLGVALLACKGAVAPLAEPIQPDRTLAAAGAWVLPDGDLPALAATARALGGEAVDVALSPSAAPIPAGSVTLQVSGTSVVVSSLDAHATWEPGEVLRFEIGLAGLVVPLSTKVSPGAVSCSFLWTATAGQVVVRARLERDASGKPVPVLAEAPSVTWLDTSVTTPGCPGVEVTQASEGIHAFVAQATAPPVGAKLGVSVLAVLRSALPAGASEAARRYTLPGRPAVSGNPRTVDMEVRFGTGDALLFRADALHFVAMPFALGLDAAASACGLDTPPPVGEPLGLSVPPAFGALPPGPVPRTLALSESSLRLAVWAALRSGAGCLSRRHGVEVALPAGLLATLSPALTALVAQEPVGARLWPGVSQSVELVDAADGGALLRLGLDGAVFEVTGEVGGGDVVILLARGSLLVDLRPVSQAGPALAFDIVAVDAQSTFTSPLLRDTLALPKTVSQKLFKAALQNLLAGGLRLDLAGLLPSGTTLTEARRSGHLMWLRFVGGTGP